MDIFQLVDFGLEDMLECSAALRAASDSAPSMEAAAGTIVRYLRDEFIDKATGEPSLALVRFYKSLPYERLEPELQAVVRETVPEGSSLRGLSCLTLLGTAGQEPAWNDRRASKAHRAIPLPTIESLESKPMVSQLVAGLGIDPDYVVHPNPAHSRRFDKGARQVFYVPEARGSPHLPDQDDFVIPYGIRSVLGVGGALPSGAMFAIVMFSTVPIPEETAQAFAVVAVSAKVGVLRFVEQRVFETDAMEGSTDPVVAADRRLRIAESQVDAMQLLIDVREEAVALQSTRLTAALEEAQNRADELAASQADLVANEARTTAMLSGALDSIVSMDADGRVLEFNPAAEATFGYGRSEVLGQTLADLIIPERLRDRHARGLARFLETGKGAFINRRVEVTAMRRDGSELPIELTVTPVLATRPPTFTGYLRDISERRAARTELLASREHLARIAHTLQASLLPPQLPDIPGLELASVYRAAGQGNDVGGDFYDVFELGDTHWAFVLGDVCGKGPAAAAITALARYTLRAAAVRRPCDPAAVLSELHDAMTRQRPDSFCTVAYAVVQPAERVVDLVLGGHPAGLRVSPSGEVTSFGGRGPLLGLVDSWAATSQVVQLSPGDTVVLYSDGVTEARRGKELFGAERLHDAAARSAAAGAAGIVPAVEAAVLDFADELADDMAILAVTFS